MSERDRDRERERERERVESERIDRLGFYFQSNTKRRESRDWDVTLIRMMMIFFFIIRGNTRPKKRIYINGFVDY